MDDGGGCVACVCCGCMYVCVCVGSDGYCLVGLGGGGDFVVCVWVFVVVLGCLCGGGWVAVFFGYGCDVFVGAGYCGGDSVACMCLCR